MGNTIYLSNRTVDGTLSPAKAYNADEVFFRYSLFKKNEMFQGKPLKEYDTNGDSYITFDEVKKDVLQFTALGHAPFVTASFGKDLEIVKIRFQIEQEKFAKETTQKWDFEKL